MDLLLEDPRQCTLDRWVFEWEPSYPGSSIIFSKMYVYFTFIIIYESWPWKFYHYGIGYYSGNMPPLNYGKDPMSDKEYNKCCNSFQSKENKIVVYKLFFHGSQQHFHTVIRFMFNKSKFRIIVDNILKIVHIVRWFLLINILKNKS